LSVDADRQDGDVIDDIVQDVIGDRRSRILCVPDVVLPERGAHHRFARLDVARRFDQAVGIEHDQ
jgi:hypothetical protein